MKNLQDPGDGNLALVSDLYHAIAQPLTALRCSLDLALRKPLDNAGYRHALKSAIDAHERVMQGISQARQIAEAAMPSAAERVDLSEVVSEIADDFEPVALSKGIALSRRIAAGVKVSCSAAKLRQLLFLVFDETLDKAASGDLRIEVKTGDSCAVISIVCEPVETVTASDLPEPKSPQQLMKHVLLRALAAADHRVVSAGVEQYILTIPNRLG